MSRAAALVRQVEDAGGRVLVDGDRVRVKASTPLSVTLVAEMRAVKADIVRLFQSRWVDRYEERAAILEFDAGLTRAEAEARAWECIIVRWLNENHPSGLDQDRCAACGQLFSRIGEEAVPVLAGEGHIWVHHGCHARLMAKRRAEAARALADMGLTPPAGWEA